MNPSHPFARPGEVLANRLDVTRNYDALTLFLEKSLRAAANAAVGEKKDVNVQGTATAAGKQQNASPNFTINVVKPDGASNAD